MKNRVLILILTLILLLSTTAFGADAGFENFQRSESYIDGQFQDVAYDQWYYGSVKSAYELGLVKGKSETAFAPNGYLTIAEAITLAARINNIYSGGTYQFIEGNPWYQTYVDYAVENEIITGSQFGDFNALATRAQFAVIFSSALPDAGFPVINNVKIGTLPDVSANEAYTQAVYKLYNAGILAGNDEYGTFNPDKNIKRSEVATIATRMADVSRREQFALSHLDIPETDIYFENSNYICPVGQSISIKPIIMPSNTTYRSVEYAYGHFMDPADESDYWNWYQLDPSANLQYAFISPDGIVTGVREGTFEVTAYTSHHLSAKCTITIIDNKEDDSAGSIPAVERIEIEDIKAYIGETIKIPFTIYPEGASIDGLKWTLQAKGGYDSYGRPEYEPVRVVIENGYLTLPFGDTLKHGYGIDTTCMLTCVAENGVYGTALVKVLTPISLSGVLIPDDYEKIFQRPFKDYIEMNAGSETSFCITANKGIKIKRAGGQYYLVGDSKFNDLSWGKTDLGYETTFCPDAPGKYHIELSGDLTDGQSETSYFEAFDINVVSSPAPVVDQPEVPGLSTGEVIMMLSSILEQVKGGVEYDNRCLGYLKDGDYTMAFLMSAYAPSNYSYAAELCGDYKEFALEKRLLIIIHDQYMVLSKYNTGKSAANEMLNVLEKTTPLTSLFLDVSKITLNKAVTTNDQRLPSDKFDRIADSILKGINEGQIYENEWFTSLIGGDYSEALLGCDYALDAYYNAVTLCGDYIEFAKAKRVLQMICDNYKGLRKYSSGSNAVNEMFNIYYQNTPLLDVLLEEIITWR